MSTAESPSALLRRLRRVSPLVGRAVVVSVLTGLIMTGAVLVQAVAVAHLLSGIFHSRTFSLTHWSVNFLAATAVRALALGVSEPATARIARPIRRDLREQLLTRGLYESRGQNVEESVQLATRGIEAIEFYVAKYVPALLLGSLAPVLLLAWLVWTDLWSFSIVLISLGLLPIFMILLGLEAKDKMQERWEQQQQLANYFGDVIRGMTVLKAFTRSNDAVQNLQEVGDSLRTNTMATLRVAFLSSFALELLSSLATALVALVLGLRLLNGSLGLNVALAVLLVTPEVFLPLRRSAAQFHASSDGIAAATEVLAQLEVPRVDGDVIVDNVAPRLSFRNVTLTPDGRLSRGARCDGIVPAGALVNLLGPSGSGKSSLLRAVAGLDSSFRGDIEVNGTPVNELRATDWHQRIGWLPQDAWLPGDTVREVLALGDDSITDDAMRAVLEQVSLPMDLDRAVGEGARGVSAGQRRRLALARCLLRRPVLLLLDEPTAHLDDESRRVVEDIIHSLPMTRLVATHRPFTCDDTIAMSWL